MCRACLRNADMVVQNYALFPHMSVRRNVAFPLRMRRMDRSNIDAMVHRALDLVELSDQIDKHPNQLSGGQQQRVALTRAIVFEPQLLVMDEPLGALDRRLRESVQFELIEMHRKLVFGYPLAYFMVRGRTWIRISITVLVVVPMFVALLVRTFGWMMIFSRTGPINRGDMSGRSRVSVPFEMGVLDQFGNDDPCSRVHLCFQHLMSAAT